MNRAKPTDDPAATEPGQDAKAMEAIGRALKAHYDDLVKAPLPERLNDLISKLGSDEDSGPQGGANASR